MRPARPSRLAPRPSQPSQDSIEGDSTSGSTVAPMASGMSVLNVTEGESFFGDSSKGNEPPSWEDGGAESDFHNEPNYRSLVKVFMSRQKWWAEELQWLKVVQEKASRIHESLKEELHLQTEEARAAIDLEERICEQIAFFSDHEGHAAKRDEAIAAAAAGARAATAAVAESAQADEAHQKAKNELETARQVLSDAEETDAKARDRATVAETASLNARLEFEERSKILEQRMLQFVEEGKLAAIEEKRLGVLQATVDTNLQDEASKRKGLREEVHRLVGELHDLDHQLVAGGSWVHEARFAWAAAAVANTGSRQ